jgi:hypothetical protein
MPFLEVKMPHLTEQDRTELIRLLQAGEPIPAQWRGKLFPGGPQSVEIGKEYRLEYAGKMKREQVLAETPAAPWQLVRRFAEERPHGDGWRNLLVWGDIRSPRPNLASIATEVQRIELHYSRFREIEHRVKSIIAKLAMSPDIFKNAPPVGQLWHIGNVRQSTLMSAEADILWLMNEGHISYSQGGTRTSVGGPNSGTFIDIFFTPTTTFITNVLPNISI